MTMKKKRKMDEKLEDAAKVIRDQDANILFCLGAGISAQSGIPTFRGWRGLYMLPLRFSVMWSVIVILMAIVSAMLYGVWASVIVVLIGIVVLVCGGVTFAVLTTRMIHGKYWSNHTNIPWVYIRWWIFKYLVFDACKSALPSDGHCAVKDIQENLAVLGKVVRVVTTNIDGLERKANINNVVYSHGRYDRFSCTSCHTFCTLEKMGLVPRRCKECNTPLRTACVLFHDCGNVGVDCESEYNERRPNLEPVKPLHGTNEISIAVGISGTILGHGVPYNPTFEINIARGFEDSGNFLQGKAEHLLPRLASYVGKEFCKKPRMKRDNCYDV